MKIKQRVDKNRKENEETENNNTVNKSLYVCFFLSFRLIQQMNQNNIPMESKRKEIISMI